MSVRVLLSRPKRYLHPGVGGWVNEPAVEPYCLWYTHVFPVTSDGRPAASVVLTRAYAEDWSAADRDPEVATLFEAPGTKTVVEFEAYLWGTTFEDLTRQQRHDALHHLREFGLEVTFDGRLRLAQLLYALEDSLHRLDHAHQKYDGDVH